MPDSPANSNPPRPALRSIRSSGPPHPRISWRWRPGAPPCPPNSDIAASLLTPRDWKSLPPPNQSAILAALLARPAHLPHVIAALASGTVHRHQLTAGQRDQLLRVVDPNLQTQAKTLLQPVAPAERQAAFLAARSALALTPDANLGRATFRQLCASCHRLDGEGIAVGPDLFDVRNQPSETLLLHILIPSQEIAPNFAQYRCETRDGRILSGLLAAESLTAITLRQAQGLQEIIPRDQIVRLEVVPESLMPDALEKTVSPQDLCNLIAFLKGGAR